MSRPILPLVLIAAIGITACTPGDSPDGAKPDEPKRGKFGEARPGAKPGGGDDAPQPAKPKFGEDRDPKLPQPAGVKFDGERCVKYVKALCDLGPRVSGTAGLTKQVELLTRHFEDLGGKVTKQEFKARQRSRRDDTPMTNMIVTWNAAAKSRVILCSHYDTRPYADQEADRKNWTKPFVSANDGASGVALMMELAHHMKDLKPEVGVDFVFFDGEEYVFDAQDSYFIGSEHFAAEYKKNKAKLPYQYVAAVLFDLCGHDGARLAIEGHSWQAAKELVNEIWGTADKLKAKSFKYERGFERGADVQDDHLALQNVGIPAVDVIDFDYKHWHTLADTPDKVSAKQMAEVAAVITTWLKAKK